MFGGTAPGDVLLGDMWSLGPTDPCWTNIIPVPADLRPRTRHRMAYNEATGEVMMFGGTVQVGPIRRISTETWFYSPTGGWFPCDDPAHPDHPCGSARPRARNGVGLAFGDGGVGRVVLFGGGRSDTDKFDDTWTWSSGEGWVCRSEPDCAVEPPPDQP